MQTSTSSKVRPLAASGTESPVQQRPVPPLVIAPIEGPGSDSSKVLDSLRDLEHRIASVHATCAELLLEHHEEDAALRHLESAVEFAPQEIDYYNQLGVLRYEAGNHEGAIAAFHVVVEHSPTQVEALSNLGMAYFEAEDFAQAKQWFQLAVEQTPQDPELWNNLGASIFELGDLDSAAQYFKRALQLEPEYLEARRNLEACD